jgi:adiponectin receptor
VLKTLFVLHNETTNIWSHLGGAFIYMFFLFYILFWTVPDKDLGLKEDDTVMGLSVGFIITINKFITKYILWLDEDIVNTNDITKWPFMVHMGGSIFCMGISSIYHLFCCHSPNAMCTLWKYDYSGVSIMIATSVFPPYIYGMWCDATTHYMYGYLAAINISSLCLAFMCIFERFEKYRNLRVVLFCIVGLSCGLPGFQYYFFRDFVNCSYCNVWLWCLGGVYFVFGAYVYAKKFPEKVYPLRFDYFGQSHNLWHFFVLLGGITNFFASLASYYGRRVQICPETALNYIGV